MERLQILLDNGLQYCSDRLLPAVVILVIGILVIRIVKALVQRVLDRSKLEKGAHTLVNSLTGVVLYLLLGLMVADKMGIDVTGVIALASVLTLAVSLALQNMLTNVIGGFTLLYTRPFSSGDYVDIGTESGTVMEIGMTYTRLQTPDNKIISIPNATVVSGNIVNYTVTGTRRLEIPVRVAYTTPTGKVLDTLMAAAEEDRVLPDPAPVAVITTYGDSAVFYELRVWTRTDDYWDLKFWLNHRVKELFDENGIEMTYPHLNVHVNP